MLLCAEFPFADVRPFIGGVTLCVPRPRHFVRRAGMDYPRMAGGVPEWPAEDLYWAARRSLLYVDRLDRRRVGPWDPGNFSGAYRRLFWDEAVLPRSRVSVAVTNTGGGRDRRRGIPGSAPSFGAQDVKLILGDFLGMPIRIAARGQLKPHRLGGAAGELASLVLASTTLWKDAADFVPPGWWVTAGRPLCLVEYGYAEEGELPADARKVSDEHDFALHFYRLRVHQEVWPVWFLRVHDPLSPNVRLIRLHLARLHAETETFRTVLELLAAESTQPEFAVFGSRADAFDDYLTKAAGLLSRRAHYGHETPKLLQSAYGYQDAVAGDSLARVEALVEKAASARPVLRRLIESGELVRTILEVTEGQEADVTLDVPE